MMTETKIYNRVNHIETTETLIQFNDFVPYDFVDIEHVNVKHMDITYYDENEIVKNTVIQTTLHRDS